nr:MAG TPA: hypothetical protein [Caudoviricetes sp.]
MRLFGQSAKKVCNGCRDVRNHCTLFWRNGGKLVILHRHSE